jgi:heme/copper-type cytochrome/quinol oxidase subunit 2
MQLIFCIELLIVLILAVIACVLKAKQKGDKRNYKKELNYLEYAVYLELFLMVISVLLYVIFKV